MFKEETFKEEPSLEVTQSTPLSPTLNPWISRMSPLMSDSVCPLKGVSVKSIHVQSTACKKQGRCFPIIFWPQAMGMNIFHPAREGIPR